ncbi:hypothetical protein [Shouchella lehensis]|uniref:Uncharacterized protein n=1 Tax=Shouchella lehensis G1 TaxID=1246626 RepID=A0A060M4G6_9BACI|nr:hypothetical protein [Shouchella lehensis]AIC95438.1 hypothetical protein BleG1_2874 [Shouchella lehensis G1]
MTKLERAEYNYEKFLDFYLLEEARGKSIPEIDNTDVNLYFKLRAHKQKRDEERKTAEPVPNTTIDSVFNF